MLSYKEYRRLKESNNNKNGLVIEDIDNVFNSWTSEVVGLILSSQNADKLINFCENAVVSQSKWKTIQEHRMIKQLPLIIRQALEEECAQARLLINEAKYQVKQIIKKEDDYANPWASFQNRDQQAADNIKGEVDVIFNDLLTDLIKTFGQNRTPARPSAGGRSPARPSAGGSPQKPGLFGRAKNWLKGVWQGATGGDQNLRRYALQRGYANDPRYQQDPHAWKDAQKHPDLFAHESKLQELEDLLKESFDDATRTINGLFSKHKLRLLDIIAKHALKTYGGEPVQRTVADIEDVPKDDKDDVKDDDTKDGVEDVEDEDRPRVPLADQTPKPEPAPLASGPKIIGSNDIPKDDLVNSIGNQLEDGTIIIKDASGQEHKVKSVGIKTVGDKKRYVFQGDDVEIHLTRHKWERAVKAEKESRLKIGEPTEAEPTTGEPLDEPTQGSEEDDHEPDVPEPDVPEPDVPEPRSEPWDDEEETAEEKANKEDEEKKSLAQAMATKQGDEISDDDTDDSDDYANFTIQNKDSNLDDDDETAKWLADKLADKDDDAGTTTPDDATDGATTPDDTTTTKTDGRKSKKGRLGKHPNNWTAEEIEADPELHKKILDLTNKPNHSQPDISLEYYEKNLKKQNSGQISAKDLKDKEKINVSDDGTINWWHYTAWKKTQVIPRGNKVKLVFKTGTTGKGDEKKFKYSAKEITKEQYSKLTGKEIEDTETQPETKSQPELESGPVEMPKTMPAKPSKQHWKQKGQEIDDMFGDD